MIILYSHGCPKCRILEQKLNQKNIKYTIDSNINKLIDMGFQSAPILQIDDKYYDFGGAIKWVNSQ